MLYIHGYTATTGGADATAVRRTDGLLPAQFAGVDFASDLGGARPAGLNTCASEHVLAHGEKLLGGFPGTQCEAARLCAHVPIIVSSL
jgi:hypothetical protein